MASNRLSRKKRRVYGPSDWEKRSAERIKSSDDSISSKQVQRLGRAAVPPMLTAESATPKELSVSRPVRRDDLELLGWTAFFNDVEQRNRQRGRFAARRLMSCEFISAEGSQRMLEGKYPKASQDTRRANRLKRDIARDFNLAINEMRQQRDEARFEQQTAPFLCTDGLVDIEGGVFVPPHDAERIVPDDLRDLEIIEDFSPDRYNGWNVAATDDFVGHAGLFAVRAIGLCADGHQLGLDLSTNEVLYEEHTFIHGYFRSEGFDVRHMSEPGRGGLLFQPYVSFFEPSGSTASRVLTFTAEMPDLLPLHPPAAHAR